MWLGVLEVRDVRNLREVQVDLDAGLNVFVGANAQGKTSLLEAVGLLARGRSFRTEQTPAMIRAGAERLRARGWARNGSGQTLLEVELQARERSLRVDGRDVPSREYQGRLEVAVYSTDRLRIVRGPMRERRLHLDRSASALWPTYRHLVRDYERVLQQRNAALEQRRVDVEEWDAQLLDLGSRLRHRRGEYAGRLGAALGLRSAAGGESYGIRLEPQPTGEIASERDALAAQLARRRGEERRARRSLVGPHRDTVAMTVDGQEATLFASSGQTRSLLLALTLASLDVYRAERGTTPVALLDDLDSELDEERTLALCREVAGRGQALVTTAHPGWTRRLGGPARAFVVAGGVVTSA